MKDIIQIKDLEVFTKIGCEANERTSSQKISLNLTLNVDGSKAAETKDLKQSVCYLTLSNHVRETISSREWNLVEELAYNVAANCLEKFKLLEGIEVEVKKFVVPATSYISFTTRKSRLD